MEPIAFRGLFIVMAVRYGPCSWEHPLKFLPLALMLCVCGFPATALAGGRDAEFDRLGKDLTPVGAERGGNQAGSIPAWEGEGVAGEGAGKLRVDVIESEKPLFVITNTNARQYQDKLSPGLLAMLSRYPGFHMPVYPAHRTAAYPKAVLEMVRKQAGNARLDGIGVDNAGGSTIPFPIPQNGLEAIWNHLLRFVGGGIERNFHAFTVRANGDAFKTGFHDLRVYDDNFDERVAGRLFWYLGYFLSPAEMVGTIYLVQEPIYHNKETRKAWIYNAGQRRVRRAPDLAYDSSEDRSDGLAIVDQYDGYNGAPDKYDWTLLGKREMFVSYNNYRMANKDVRYADILSKQSVNSDLMRYELHRTWVVEATLKSGESHVYARRVFYLDEDTWSVLLTDNYDAKGNLWRTGIHSVLQYVDANVPWYRFELWHDLSNGSYVLTGLDNEFKDAIRFGVRGKSEDFQPDALRRLGR